MHYICEFNFCPANRYRNPNENVDRNMIALFSRFPEESVYSFENKPFSSEFQISIVGKYDTLDEARTAFLALYPEHRAASDSDVVTLNEAYDGLVDVFKPGKFDPLGPEGSLVWIGDDMVRGIKPETTDEEIAHLWVAYQQEANNSGNILDEIVVDALRDYRDELCRAASG